MTIGASLITFAIGAILRFAVTADVNGVDLNTIGDILMVVGAAGLILGLILTLSRRRTDVVSRNGHTTILEPRQPGDPGDPRY